jgi:hypothetical protein
MTHSSGFPDDSPTTNNFRVVGSLTVNPLRVPYQSAAFRRNRDVDGRSVAKPGGVRVSE